MKKRIHPIKRKLIQLAAFGFSNAHPGNFAQGQLYKGAWKQFCNPGLHCYSCPAAGFACPIGAMQAVNGSWKFGFSFYVAGFLLALGVLFGRFICGWICPFGLVQELLHKIPTPKAKLPRPLRWLKYGVLAVFVLGLPLLATDYMGMGKPAFCQYICPSGTLFGGIPLVATHPELENSIGGLFWLKVSLLVAILVGSVFIFRFFCKALCPLGVIYGLCNRISVWGLRLDKNRCIGCGKCASVCRMQVNPAHQPNGVECIRCGDCIKVCPKAALRFGTAFSAKGKPHSSCFDSREEAEKEVPPTQ